MNYPKIKRAQTVYVSEEGMPYEAYETKSVETERKTRAAWETALVAALEVNDDDNEQSWSKRLDEVILELKRVAEEDDK